MENGATPLLGSEEMPGVAEGELEFAPGGHLETHQEEDRSVETSLEEQNSLSDDGTCLVSGRAMDAPGDGTSSSLQPCAEVDVGPAASQEELEDPQAQRAEGSSNGHQEEQLPGNEDDQPDLQQEEVQWVRERNVLCGELGCVKAKFELTLQTLRSILGLESSCSWADMLEHCEALANPSERKIITPSCIGEVDEEERDHEDDLASLLLQAEMDLDDKEQQLEEQHARIREISEVLSKQQTVLDMTSNQLADQNEQKELLSKQREELLHVSSERDRFREEAQKYRELYQISQERLHERDGQVTALDHTCEQMKVSLQRLEQDYNQSQADTARHRSEIEELCNAVAVRDEDLQKVREKLEVHEAAEQRSLTYRPHGGLGTRHCRSGLLDDLVSEQGSSVSSARASARGPGHSSSSQELRRPWLRQTPPLATMDEEERQAFLAHFPMASRTERHMRKRIDDGKPSRRPLAGSGDFSAREIGSQSVGSHGSPLASARTNDC